MRMRFALAIIFYVTAASAASTADIGGGFSGIGVYSPYAARIEPIVIFDYEPGVIVRSYWDVPWQNRHYFPSTGRRPKVGRLERIPAKPAPRAEDYYRFWSASSVFLPASPATTINLDASGASWPAETERSLPDEKTKKQHGGQGWPHDEKAKKHHGGHGWPHDEKAKKHHGGHGWPHKARARLHSRH
ncbi:MAG TPA: hypothetical protein VFP60_19165 [Pseudolabrys sp.]|nr:hypothetical protein [Pseudolabrys sp.]